MRALAGVLLCLLACPATAQEVNQVTGVRASDVLNVRRAPSATAPIVGTLSPLADFVIVRERRGGWVRIEFARGVPTPVAGWVSARYLERAENGHGPDDGVWSCSGTEPFWGLWIEGGQVRYQTDLGTTVTPLGDVHRSRNEPSSTWSFRFGQGEDAGTAIMIDGQVCSDGMSDRTTRRTVLLTYPQGGLLNGCCQRPPADARPPEPTPSQE